MLLRFAYLAISHAFAELRLLRRQLAGQRPHLRPEDRAFLAALLSTPRDRPERRAVQGNVDMEPGGELVVRHQ